MAPFRARQFSLFHPGVSVVPAPPDASEPALLEFADGPHDEHGELIRPYQPSTGNNRKRRCVPRAVPEL